MKINYLTYIGLNGRSNKRTEKEKNSTGESVPKISYSPICDLKVADRYLAYLNAINEQQFDRRTTIENKNSQLVGQASIVTSIFALFVPLLIDSLSGVSLWVKIPITLFFLIVIFHYILSILHAIRTLTVNKYRYPSRSTVSVTKKDRKENELDFVNTEIEDLIFIIDQTTPIDNIKGENLIYGARCFKIGNIGFGIMTLFVIISTFTLKKENPELTIKNLNELRFEVPDTLNTRLIDLHLKDTLTVRIDSLKSKTIR